MTAILLYLQSVSTTNLVSALPWHSDGETQGHVPDASAPAGALPLPSPSFCLPLSVCSPSYEWYEAVAGQSQLAACYIHQHNNSTHYAGCALIDLITICNNRMCTTVSNFSELHNRKWLLFDERFMILNYANKTTAFPNAHAVQSELVHALTSVLVITSLLIRTFPHVLIEY